MTKERGGLHTLRFQMIQQLIFDGLTMLESMALTDFIFNARFLRNIAFIVGRAFILCCFCFFRNNRCLVLHENLLAGTYLREECIGEELKCEFQELGALERLFSKNSGIQVLGWMGMLEPKPQTPILLLLSST